MASGNLVVDYCNHCQSKLHGPFCAHCGNRANALVPTLGDLMGDWFEALTNADSRLWRTVHILLRYPGRMAKLYMEGYRAQLLPPTRLYLVVSLIFFLVLSIDGSPSPDVEPSQDLKITAESAQPQPTQEPECDVTYDGPFSAQVEPRLKIACEQFAKDQGALIAQRFLNNLPAAMFVLMPLFATAMLLWYWNPKRLFLEHLVFQVFNHAGLFLIAIVFQLLEWALPASIAGYIGLAIFPIAGSYAFFSLKTYYGQSALLTIWKFFSLTVVYLMLLAMVMLLTGLSAIW